MVVKDFIGRPSDFKGICDSGDGSASFTYFASRHRCGTVLVEREML